MGPNSHSVQVAREGGHNDMSDFDFNEIKKEVGDVPKSVIEMRRQLEGLVTGYGTLVGVTEQYVVVSRTVAVCSGNVRCACDASPDEHTRPCGYSVDIKHNPPVPVIVSVFDTGNGKALVCPRCKGIDYNVMMDRRIAKLIVEDAKCRDLKM